ncbi:site-specific integrase [Sphingobium sp. Sx8-8]|uniref:tyrosine-type recombinase/integrase n=1 Tax=Sphingobium sp. Sx8-8 TaxID=2933617 RepID=UPI001F566177|nr:site-specific integrase [Sphingobium sp. Sx8-8]
MTEKTVVLTKRAIDAAQPKEKRYDIWDSEIAGFGLRVGVSGAKTFVFRYRAEGGGRGAPKRHVTIGRFGPLTVELARRQAKQLLAKATVGEDPAKVRNDKRAEMRISDLIDLYEEEGCYIQRGKRQGTPMKPLTRQYTLARLRHHVVPLLGSSRVTAVNAGDIERFFRDVEAGKTARDDKIGPRRRIVVKGGEGAARKVFRDLSAVFSFARRREIIDRNPCDTASVRKTDNHKDRYLTLDEVKRFGEALRELESDGINRKALDIMRLWMLTGCRREEIASLKWGEVDFDHGSFRFGDTKTGKNVRPIGAAAIAVLRTIERNEDSDFVFPSEDGDGYFRGYKTPWKKAVDKAGLPDVTPHTLRHTMGSTAISSGEAMAFTGAILGHANPRSTAIYAHVQHNPARRAADRVAERIAAALAGMSDAEVDAPPADEDEDLLRRVAETLMKGGAEAERLRVVINALAV